MTNRQPNDIAPKYIPGHIFVDIRGKPVNYFR